MKTYETTYIFTSKETSGHSEALLKEIESLILQKDGVILSSDKKGFQTLAYPIKKESSGFFTTLTYQAKEETVKELRLSWDKNKGILRYMVTIKKPYKEAKKMRTRKPSFMSSISKLGQDLPFVKHHGKKESEKVNLAEIEKKLEEI